MDVYSVILIIESIAIILIAFANIFLHFYASLAVGYSFDRYCKLISVAAFFAFNIIEQMLMPAGLLSLNGMDFREHTHLILLALIIFLALTSAAYYLITFYLLKRRMEK